MPRDGCIMVYVMTCLDTLFKISKEYCTDSPNLLGNALTRAGSILFGKGVTSITTNDNWDYSGNIMIFNKSTGYLNLNSGKFIISFIINTQWLFLIKNKLFLFILFLN